jgi:hypothetical protein
MAAGYLWLGIGLKDKGCCGVCATDVLSFVASIFARGSTKK